MANPVLIYVAAKRRHPGPWQIIDLFLGAGVVIFLWYALGDIAGIAFAAIWGLLCVLDFAVYIARRRAAG